jgi:AraC-like DNA-binding protein
MVAPSVYVSRMVELVSALSSNASADVIDRVLSDSVDFARRSIGLERVAIFLFTPDRQSMAGTWGTDGSGQTGDEHDVMFSTNDLVRQLFENAERGCLWTVYQDCPLVAHEGGQSRIIARGWNVGTVIRGAGEPHGIMFNDSALSGAPVDEDKQAWAAVLCSLLGRALDPCLVRFFDGDSGEERKQHPLVRRAAYLLASEPAMSFEALAQRLRVSKGYLTRTFKRCAGTSIVSYRNELRLAQFLNQIGSKPVLAAALGAGFGSYPQFHRVFRARFGKTPREYLFEQRSMSRPDHASPMNAAQVSPNHSRPRPSSNEAREIS